MALRFIILLSITLLISLFKISLPSTIPSCLSYSIVKLLLLTSIIATLAPVFFISRVKYSFALLMPSSPKLL